MVRPVGAEPVPQAQVVKKGGHEKSFDSAGTGHVVVIHVPNVTHGRMAIADVQRFRGSQHAFGWAGFAGNNEIVAAKIELLQCQGHERQIVLVPAL